MELLNSICIIIAIYFMNSAICHSIAEGVTWKWKIFYSLRDKYKFLTHKPFICTPCLSFWLLLTVSMIIFPKFYIFNIIYSFSFFLYLKWVEYKKYNT